MLFLLVDFSRLLREGLCIVFAVSTSTCKLSQLSTSLNNVFLLVSSLHFGFINFISWPIVLRFWVMPNLSGFCSVWPYLCHKVFCGPALQHCKVYGIAMWVSRI